VKAGKTNSTEPKKGRLVVRCALAAVAAEVILISVSFLLGNVRDNGQSFFSLGGAILYFWHLSGFVLLDKVGVRVTWFTSGFVCFFLVGFAEFFVVFWSIGHLLRAFYSRRLVRRTPAAHSTAANDEEFRRLLNEHRERQA
jgi:hypothetical protein